MKRFFHVLLAVCLLLSLAACGGATGGEATYGDAGYYDVYSLTNSLGTLDRAAMDARGVSVGLTLREDGGGVLDLGGGDAVALTWRDGSVTAGGGTVPYALEGGMLTLDLSDGDGALVLVFQKGEPAPAATPEASATPEPEDTPAPTEEAAPAEPEEGAPLAEFQPVSGDIDGRYHIEITGASRFRDYEGRDAIRVYYLSTNISDDVATTWWVLNVAAEQSGEPLEYTFASDEGVNGIENYAAYSVQPGVTVPCVESFCVDMDGGPITVTISDEDSVTAVFEPGSLADFSPLEDWEIEPIDDPLFYIEYPLSASTEGCDIEIVDAELVDPMPGRERDSLRVYFQITNRTDEAVEAFWLVSVMAYQDGIELATEPAAEWQETDGLYDETVQPGETVVFSRCWTVRTENPIEVVITDSYGSDGVIAAATMPIS